MESFSHFCFQFDILLPFSHHIHYFSISPPAAPNLTLSQESRDHSLIERIYAATLNVMHLWPRTMGSDSISASYLQFSMGLWCKRSKMADIESRIETDKDSSYSIVRLLLTHRSNTLIFRDKKKVIKTLKNNSFENSSPPSWHLQSFVKLG